MVDGFSTAIHGWFSTPWVLEGIHIMGFHWDQKSDEQTALEFHSWWRDHHSTSTNFWRYNGGTKGLVWKGGTPVYPQYCRFDDDKPLDVGVSYSQTSPLRPFSFLHGFQTSSYPKVRNELGKCAWDIVGQSGDPWRHIQHAFYTSSEPQKQTQWQLLFDLARVAVIHQFPVNSSAFLFNALNSPGRP